MTNLTTKYAFKIYQINLKEIVKSNQLWLLNYKTKQKNLQFKDYL